MNKNGLTSTEVLNQTKQGNLNIIKKKSSQSYFSIIIKNIFTYFNAIFLIIALLLISVESYRSLTFLPVIIANVIIGIFQQIRSKRVLDKLNLLDKSVYTVIRDGKETKLPSESLVKGDLLVLKGGQQIPADCIIEEGFLSVNEALLTGEADEIEKKVGSELLSGSFVVSGQAYVTLTNVGKNSYSAKLMSKAKEIKDKKSEMIKDIERIILFAGIIIIPIGIALFIQSYITNKMPLQTSIESMVAAIIGMIPEGMYLLTTVALALSAIRLGQKNVLLHDMRSIETLARVDVLCVDKTGTITENDMSVTGTLCKSAASQEEKNALNNELIAYLNTVTDENQTTKALKKFFFNSANSFDNKLDAQKIENFSSKTKCSTVTTAACVYKLGAPEVVLDSQLLDELKDEIKKQAEQGKRVLAFVKLKNEKICNYLLVFLNNEIRKNAPEIFGYFEKQGVEIKIISGDNPLTVSHVAIKAGIKNADKYIDATTLNTDEEVLQAVQNYTVFGRVKPEQKKQIILALKKLKLKVAMTGDGVNDILAMKEADCSISMGTGSDAAREASQVVLMDSDFKHMENIVSEGRRDINNITRTATLFLYKNVFSILMATFSIIRFRLYPLEPSQVSLVSMFNIGVPAFLLTLEPNERKQQGKFINETLFKALPAALTSFLAIVALANFAKLFDIPQKEISTASTYLLSVGGYIILWRIIRPFNKYRIAVFALCIICFAICINVFYDWFSIESISLRGWGLCVLFAIAQASIMRWISILIAYIRKKIEKKRAVN